jgi:hypothetical protein
VLLLNILYFVSTKKSGRFCLCSRKSETLCYKALKRNWPRTVAQLKASYFDYEGLEGQSGIGVRIRSGVDGIGCKWPTSLGVEPRKLTSGGACDLMRRGCGYE